MTFSLFLALTYFIRLLGPAAGYALASFSLNLYIAPDLTPVISNKDPRWLGAWYFGWIFIAAVLFSFSIVMALFPKQLPRAAVRKSIIAEKERRRNKNKLGTTEESTKTETSLKDFVVTFKRLLKNKLFMMNNLAATFYVFGFMPFWIYSPKLIETLFRQTSAASSLYTGTFALMSSALGLLIAGFAISKYKPRARYLAFWNVIVGFLSVASVLSYSFMGCDESRNAVSVNYDAIPSCNSDCFCDFAKYSPVCGVDGVTYISACHAGCKSILMKNTTRTFSECSCIEGIIHHELKQTAQSGPCFINCKSKLTLFLIVMCFMKFIGASGRASNFLVGVRCVEERDKTLAIGFGMSMVRLLAAVPSPIIFGYIIDNACVAWGKTCTGKGNCWLYDGEVLRYWFFYVSATSIAIGTFFDFMVWRNAKSLKIFDDEEKDVNEIKEEK